MARAEAAAAPPPVVSAEGKRGRPQTLEPSGHGGHCSKQQDHSRRLGSLARHLVSSSPRQQGSGPRAAVSADLDARRPPSPTELTEMQQAAAKSIFAADLKCGQNGSIPFFDHDPRAWGGL